MSDRFFDKNDVNKLINSILGDNEESNISLLRNRYENKLAELGITSHQVEKNLKLEYRTLNGILDGYLERFDLLALIKIGHFLEIPENEIMPFYLKLVSEKNKGELEIIKRRAFILNNFDLGFYKSLGVITSVQDFDHIEQMLNQVFGLNSIMEYDDTDVGAALSSITIMDGKKDSKKKRNPGRTYFINKARNIFQRINNPNPYVKQDLVDYFPKIRWHSTDFENGIANVMKSLFALGVTVIFQPSVPSMKMRGATFAVNGKPCIVLTDFRKSYPTIWFAFLHELFHILFDWAEILEKRYHLSDEENDLYVVRQKEEEANEFAREYLFPDAKLEYIANRINQRAIIREFALDNHVHPSIVYANYAFKYSTPDQNLWALYDKQIRPTMDVLLRNLNKDFTNTTSVVEYSEYYRKEIFNI